MSTALYLTSGVGGPTRVTNQRTGEGKGKPWKGKGEEEGK